jgi:hypothetical protein
MAEKYTWVRAVTSQVLSRTPCLFGCVILTPDAQAQADVTFYDGESDQDPELVTVRSGSGVTKVVRFQPCLQSQRGLYVKKGDNVEEVLIQFEVQKE